MIIFVATYLELEHWLRVVDPDKDLSHHKLVFVSRKFELWSESRITNSATDRWRPFGFDELRQLGSSTAIAHEQIFEQLPFGIQMVQACPVA